MLSDSQKSQIKEWALKEAPMEICGIIYCSGESIHISKSKNIAGNKENYFEIDPLLYLKVSNNKKNKILGFFHSQKENQPSLLDYMVARGHNYYSLIYSVKENEFLEVNNETIKYQNYLYRPFLMGSNDCLGLIIDFYKKEYNIIVTNFLRDENWFEKNSNIIKDNIEKEGFVIITDFKNIKEGDIIVFSYKHMGIYLENNFLLHCPYNGKSTVEKLNNSNIKRIDIILRHKNRL